MLRTWIQGFYRYVHVHEAKVLQILQLFYGSRSDHPNAGKSLLQG